MSVGRPLLRDEQSSFGGGLNSSADESELKKNEIREGANAHLTEHGGITKRRGTQRTHDVAFPGPVKGGYTWRKTSPATHLVIADGSLFTAPHGSFPWSWSDHGAGIDPNVLPSFASFRDVAADALYVADGGQLHKYKPGALTLNLPGTPTVSRIAVQNLRLFAVGDPSAPETMYFSGLSNGDTLGQVAAGGGSAIIRTFAHEPLTAVLAVGQSLLIFHERGISRFTGWSQDDFNVDAGTRGVTQDVGTISPDSVVGIENVGFFMSDRGVYAVTESGVQQISAKVENILAAIPASDLRLVSAAHRRNARQVWFSIPNLGVMVYDYRIRAWAGPLIDVYLDQAPAVFWESGAGETSQIFMGGVDGFVRQADIIGIAKDDILADGTGGAVYAMNVRCHRMFFGSPVVEKSLRYLYATANLHGSAGASLGWETGQEAGTETLPDTGTAALWNAVVWGAAAWGVGGSTTERVHANGRGHYVDLRIVDSGLTISLFSRLEAEAYAMGGRY